MFDIEYQISDIQMSDIEDLISNIIYQISDIEYLISNIGYRISDIQYLLFDIINAQFNLLSGQRI